MAPLDLGRASRFARQLLDRIAADSADPPGVTRAAYQEGERLAFARVAEAAKDWADDIRFDAAGNQFVRLAGEDGGGAIEIGSHLDSVPHGGNFDGAAGVVLGLALQSALAAAARRPPFDLVVVCLRAEESCWFPHSYIGSKTALGALGPAALDVRHSRTGRTLAEHMLQEGFDPAAVRRGERLIEPQKIVAHIEPHIEQGPLLLSENLPLGIVTGIRGSFRYRSVRLIGDYAHSGATPRHLRRDAVVAAARLVAAMEALWDELEKAGRDVAVTFGEFGTDPASHSFSKVAGEVRLSIDVRSQDSDTLDGVRRRLEEAAEAIARETGVAVELGAISGAAPASMSRPLNDMLAEACGAAHAPFRFLPSGAGHDAATYAQAGVPTAMLFIRSENGSHNPAERMDMADFDRALAVLAALMEMPKERWLVLRPPPSEAPW
jgi:N-carbamoyl-L-amino-acid hydrolase